MRFLSPSRFSSPILCHICCAIALLQVAVLPDANASQNRPVAHPQQVTPTAAIGLPTEEALLTVCTNLPRSDTWQLGPYPSDADLGFKAGMEHSRVRSSEGIRCALALAEFLSIRGDHQPAHSIAEEFIGNPAKRDDHSRSDRLLWGLVAEYKFDTQMVPDRKSQIIAGMLSIRDAQNPKTRASAIAELAALALADPSEQVQQFKADHFERIFQAVIGETINNLCIFPLPDPKTWQAADAEPPDRLEVTATYWLLSEFFEMSLSPTTSDDFLNVELPVGATFSSADKPFLRKLDLMAIMSRMPTEVTAQVMIDWMKITKPVILGQSLAGTESWTDPATFNLSENIYIGRCGDHPTTINTVTSLKNNLNGFQCDYNGAAGYANINFTTVYTAPTFFGRTPGNDYVVRVDSQLFGGHRNGSFLGPSDEDETATVNYTVSGTAMIPQCTDVGICNPLIDFLLHDNNEVGDKSTDDPTISQQISYSVPGQPQPVLIPSGTHVLVDRTAGPIQLQFLLRRNDKHLGAGTPKPWVINWISLTANAALAPTQNSADAPILSAKYYLQSPDFRSFLPGYGRYTLGQIPGNLRQLTSPHFDNRFKEIYLRLFEVGLLEAVPGDTIDGYDRKSLMLARASLSEAARRAYFDTGRQVYHTIATDLAVISFPTILNTIDQAVEHLIATSGSQDIDSLEFLDGLAQQFQAAGTDSGVPAAVAATKAAAQQNDRAVVIEKLLELRSELGAAEQDWQSRLENLAVELSLFDPRISTDRSLI